MSRNKNNILFGVEILFLLVVLFYDKANSVTCPKPFSEWDFANSSLNDKYNNSFGGVIVGDAHIDSNNMLVLTGNGYMKAYLRNSISIPSFTLEVWVYVDDLTQISRVVLGIVNRARDFDAIVFGQEVASWYPASDMNRRNPPFPYSIEYKENRAGVLVKISLAIDGVQNKAFLYRNGVLLKSHSPTNVNYRYNPFFNDGSYIGFGTGLLPFQPTNTFIGRIKMVRIYNKTLTAEEIKVSHYNCTKNPVEMCIPCTPTNITCGCYDNTQVCLQTSSNKGKCVCAPDFVQDKQYTSPVCIPRTIPNIGPGSATATGDPHFKTFDNLMYDFQGRCEYVFVNSSTLLVHIITDECYTNKPKTSVSCTKAAAFRYKNDVVEFSSTECKLNGVTVSTFPLYLNSGITITSTRIGNYVAEMFDKSIVTFKHIVPYVPSLRVDLPSHYANKVNGLGGNFDRVQANEFQLRNGSIVKDPYIFGKNWAVEPASSLFTTTFPVCSTPEITDPLSSCTENLSVCDNIAVDEECSKLLDIEKLKLACIHDVCVFGQDGAGWISDIKTECDIEKQRKNQQCEVWVLNTGCQPQ